MKLHDLKPAAGSKRDSYRKGRGHGSGNGKLAGRGRDGQNSRSGGGVRVGFEGGKMPLYRRIPKRGFNNVFAKTFAEVKVSSLEVFETGTVVDIDMLVTAGIVGKKLDKLAVLGNGEKTKA